MVWKCQLNDAIVLLPGDRTTQVALSAESSRHQEANRRTNRARVLGTNSRGSQDLHLCCIVFLTVLQARVCACSLLTRARSLLTRSLVRYRHAPHACVCTCMCVSVFKTMAITTRSSSNQYAMMMLRKITIVRSTSGGNSGTQRNTTQHNDRMSQRAHRHLRAWFIRHRTDFTVLRHLLTLRIFTELSIVLRNVWQQHKT